VMLLSPGRIAIGSFQSWDVAHRVLNELIQMGIAQERVILLGLSTIFLSRPVDSIPMPDFVELPAFQLGDPVCCSARFVAAKMAARKNGGGSTLERSLGCCLLPRQSERVATYVKQGRIVMGILLAKGEDERRACLTLLSSSSSPVEIHDVVSGSR
jgi:hypothetical protein